MFPNEQVGFRAIKLSPVYNIHLKSTWKKKLETLLFYFILLMAPRKDFDKDCVHSPFCFHPNRECFLTVWDHCNILHSSASFKIHVYDLNFNTIKYLIPLSTTLQIIQNSTRNLQCQSHILITNNKYIKFRNCFIERREKEALNIQILKLLWRREFFEI
jgi:hypothetical protein